MIHRFVSTAVRLSYLASALLPPLAATLSASLSAQERDIIVGAKPFDDRFRQLEEILPTPNSYRTASGAPGHGYWQQKVDYDIAVELDDAKQTLHGRERIRYSNRSPDTLRYLWLQLEGNLFTPGSDQKTTATFDEDGQDMQFSRLRQLLAAEDFDGGFKIDHVTSAGRDLDYTIVKTMMRVDLPTDAPLGPGASREFEVEWRYRINPHKYVPGRSGAEFFESDGNWIYEVAHWFPRLCAYTDSNGWQHKQFLGRGEFTLEFGDYDVRITVPKDHVVAATGELRNADDVLQPAWKERLARARVSSDPVFIITPDEAKANQSSRADRKATWIFHADNVRDFSWATSRKFIWDAQGHHSAACAGDGIVLAMSYWPIEGEPLWSRYSTRAVVHTLESYGKFAFDYPYPVAISVNGPVGGMEYPMICFNGPRPEADGTYSARTKYGLISVVIHEVGHNWFPMIVNSDERQWTWMDEGLNTFVQYLAEKEWEDKYPSWTGEPRQITEYMASANQVPIMTNSESILQFGPNAYFKPATALNILRETILGRELFDFAFREYARRWRFSRPMPADFFRTMEDASGIDLDWFWRGWFYSTDHVDIALSDVREFAIDGGDPDARAAIAKADRAKNAATVSAERNRELPKKVERVPQLADFYNRFDDLDPTAGDRERFEKFVASLDEEERKLLATEGHFYVLDFDNEGGLVMPILLRMHHADGTSAWLRMPAEIWRKSPRHVKKLIYSEREIVRFVVDPMGETADVDESDNEWPRRRAVSRFRLFKDAKDKNPMQEADEAAKKARASSATGAEDGAAPKNSGGDR